MFNLYLCALAAKLVWGWDPVVGPLCLPYDRGIEGAGEIFLV